MISTPAIFFLDRPLPPQSGQAPRAAVSEPAPDFAALISRLFAANLPVAALATAAEILPATAAVPERDESATEQAEAKAGRTDPKDPEAPLDETDAAAGERLDRPLAVQPDNAAADTIATETVEATAPAQAQALSSLPIPQQAGQPQPAPVAPPAAQGAERLPVQATQALLHAKDGETAPTPPLPTVQQARLSQSAAGDLLRAQVVDGGTVDRLPQFGHTLSGRAAVVAQSDSGNTALPKEASAAPKGGPVDPAAASLLGNAAQASPVAAQRAKGQTRLGNAAGNSQGANGAQGNQPAAQQAQQTAPAALPPQNGFNNALAAAANGTNGQAAGAAPQAARSESSALAGAGGQPAPQANFRAAEPIAALKPRTPLPPRFVANQVAVQIQKSVSQGSDRISIQLKPAELGKVEVRLDVGSDGRVSAVITADRADTLDLLQRDARILQNSLQDAGLRADSNSLSFELKGNGQAFAEAHDQGPGSGDADAMAGDGTSLPDAVSTAARLGIITNDRVDIHV